MRIDQDILEIIESGDTKDNLYYLPKVQLDRKTYVKINKVLELLGGKWNKKLKAHVFPNSIDDAIDNVLLTGEVKDIKKELQFFETPPELAKDLVEKANLKEGLMCLEPSAGKGNIAEAIAEVINKDYIICYDINPEFVNVLNDKGFRAVSVDFMSLYPGESYDRIVMNPPFTKQQDLDHVLHALNFLEKGGILVAVMSAGVVYRTNNKTKKFWDIIHQYRNRTWKLPEGTFKSSGTMVETIILKVEKVI